MTDLPAVLIVLKTIERRCTAVTQTIEIEWTKRLTFLQPDVTGTYNLRCWVTALSQRGVNTQNSTRGGKQDAVVRDAGIQSKKSPNPNGFHQDDP